MKRTDRQTDRPTDIAIFRAPMELKIGNEVLKFVNWKIANEVLKFVKHQKYKRRVLTTSSLKF